MANIVGAKTLFEGWAERGIKGLARGWWLKGRITHFELHATKGFRRIGRQHSAKFVREKPKTWKQGYQSAEIIRFGRRLDPLTPSDIEKAKVLA